MVILFCNLRFLKAMWELFKMEYAVCRNIQHSLINSACNPRHALAEMGFFIILRTGSSTNHALVSVLSFIKGYSRTLMPVLRMVFCLSSPPCLKFSLATPPSFAGWPEINHEKRPFVLQDELLRGHATASVTMAITTTIVITKKQRSQDVPRFMRLVATPHMALSKPIAICLMEQNRHRLPQSVNLGHAPATNALFFKISRIAAPFIQLTKN